MNESSYVDKRASVSAKRITERDAIFRYPVAVELVEIIDVVNIDLRPDEDAPFNVETQPSAQMRLKMI